MIDGGINEATIVEALSAGANVIVSGSSIFGNDRKFSEGIVPLRDNLRKFIAIVAKHGV